MDEQSTGSQAPSTPPSERSSTPTSSAKVTHKTAEIFGLGSGITDSDAEITGSRLPTCRQVLRSLMYHLRKGVSEPRTRIEAAKSCQSSSILWKSKHSSDFSDQGLSEDDKTVR